MKRFILSLALVMGLFGMSYATVGDYFTVTDENNNDLIRVDSNKDFIFASEMDSMGSATNKIDKIYVADLNVSSFSLPINAMDYWSDLPAASSAAVYTIATTSTAAKVFGTDVLTQPSSGRTITVSMGNDTDDSRALTGTAVISGITSKGDSVNETVSIAARLTQYSSNNPFVYIGSVTFTVLTWNNTTTQDSCVCNVGIGAKIGLSNDLITSTDIIAAREGTVVSNYGAVQAGANTTYDTVDFVTDPNGTNDYCVWYKIRKAP